MKLYFTSTSPYVRKVVVTAMETGLDAKIERINANLAAPDAQFKASNPVGKVPTLITDGGEALFDSPVICEYLDSLHDGVKLFPPAAGARWQALRRQALGDGFLDAAVAVRYETLRPASEQSPSWLAKQKGKVETALNALEEEAEQLAQSPVTIGHIAIACGLGYLDFRFADDNWRAARPSLADWFATFAERPSMKASAPVE